MKNKPTLKQQLAQRRNWLKKKKKNYLLLKQY